MKQKWTDFCRDWHFLEKYLAASGRSVEVQRMQLITLPLSLLDSTATMEPKQLSYLSLEHRQCQYLKCGESCVLLQSTFGSWTDWNHHREQHSCLFLKGKKSEVKSVKEIPDWNVQSVVKQGEGGRERERGERERDVSGCIYVRIFGQTSRVVLKQVTWWCIFIIFGFVFYWF